MLLVSSFFNPPAPPALNEPKVAEAAEPPQPTEVSATTTIENAAKKYGIDPVLFLDTAECEDPGLVPDQQSNYIRKDGTREPSFGIFQIDTDYNNVSIASATDPVFAANWAAKEWSEGLAIHWSCYRLIKSSAAST